MKSLAFDATQLGHTCRYAWMLLMSACLLCGFDVVGGELLDPPDPKVSSARNGSMAAQDAMPEVWLCVGGRISDLLEADADWPFVKQHLTGIKLYVGQLYPKRRRSAGATSEDLQKLAKFVQDNELQVAVELGGCLEFSPLDDTAGEWSARRELTAIDNFYAAGGKVDYLDVDGPVRRLMHPMKRHDGRRFESIEKAANELVDALRIHRQAHPETRYWLLTNFPNWGWRGDVSYHARGPQRQDYGDYDSVVREVLSQLKAAGIPLDGVTVDNPYDYLTGEHRSVKIPDPTAIDWLGRVRSYEEYARQNGLKFNLIVNSERGGHESDERFGRETVAMVDAYLRAGGRPSRWFVQSWYAHPKQMVPESAPHTMTATVKAVMERLESSDAEAKFCFAQLCDTQLGFGAAGYETDIKSFRQAVRQINQSEAEFAVICGDLVNSATPETLADFKKVVSEFEIPCYCVPGNHDVGGPLVLKKLEQYRKTVGKDRFSFVHNGCSFIGLNTQLWKSPVEPEAADQEMWFVKELQLAADRSNPIFVIGHHPLFLKAADEKEEYFNIAPQRRKQIFDLFQEYGVVAMLTGHTHRLYDNRYREIFFLSGETTSKNFDQRPLGFRLWEVGDRDSIRHRFVPLELGP